MTQLIWLAEASSVGKFMDHHNHISSYAMVHGIKIPPPEEFLGVSSTDGGSSEFGDDYEKQALKRLEEMNGKRTPNKN